MQIRVQDSTHGLRVVTSAGDKECNLYPKNAMAPSNKKMLTTHSPHTCVLDNK